MLAVRALLLIVAAVLPRESLEPEPHARRHAVSAVSTLRVLRSVVRPPRGHGRIVLAGQTGRHEVGPLDPRIERGGVFLFAALNGLVLDAFCPA